MGNPYEAPTSNVSAVARPPARRWVRPILAFVSGLLLLPMLTVGTLRLRYDNPVSYGNGYFWGSVVLGSFIAGLMTLPFPRMPVWLVVLLGPLIVLLTIVLVVALGFLLGMFHLAG